MASKLDNVIIAISREVPDVSYGKIAQISLKTVERLLPNESAKSFLKDVVLNSMHKEDRVEALRILTKK